MKFCVKNNSTFKFMPNEFALGQLNQQMHGQWQKRYGSTFTPSHVLLFLYATRHHSTYPKMGKKNRKMMYPLGLFSVMCMDA